MPLSSVLDQSVRAIWPRRTQRELLLDLGERKRWSEVDHDATIQAVATWLQDELLLPTVVDVSVSPPAWGDLRALGEALATAAHPGVARWAVGMAPALGTTGKTLANSVSRGLRSDRADHRWWCLITRVVRGDHPVDAWVFHERTPDSVTTELAAMAGRHPHLDAGDAVLVLSLLALWQRRRPVTRARANRGRGQPRRTTPKPVAAIAGTLAVPGQLVPLGRLSRQIGGAGGRALLLLALEAALTEAHLVPHPARRSPDESMGKGETWLCGVERVLCSHADFLEDEASAVLRYRVERMRAWRDGSPQPATPEGIVRHPYVHASQLLLTSRGSTALPEPVHCHTRGLLMLLPQLRSRGFQVLP